MRITAQNPSRANTIRRLAFSHQPSAVSRKLIAESRKPILVLCGPTASGKTELMSHLNEKLPMEVISADSRQVYKGFTLGTGKPSPAIQRRLPHHLIDILNPEETFTAGDFCRRALNLLPSSPHPLGGHPPPSFLPPCGGGFRWGDEPLTLSGDLSLSLKGRGRSILPICDREREKHSSHIRMAVVGGTGLYIRSLTQGLSRAPRRNEALRQKFLLKEKRETGALYKRLARVDPPWAQRLHPNNLHRVIRALEIYEITKQPPTIFFSQHQPYPSDIRFICFALLWPREVLRRRIRERIARWLKNGWEEEIGHLLQTVPLAASAWKSVGYLTLTQRVRGKLSREEASEKIFEETCQYAKRQMTWFRAEKNIRWIPAEGKSPKVLIAEILKEWKN